MSFIRRHWPIVFLALIPLLPLWKPMLTGEAIGPFDQIRQMAPWFGKSTSQPWDVLQADGALQFYGWRDLVFESWGKLQAPMVNPYQLAGAPLAANSQSGAFYPPHILFGLLHLPTSLAITLLAWLHLFWAGLGAFRLSRILGAREFGAVLAGAGFSLSAFMLGWLSLGSVPSTVAWIPWVLACVLHLVPAAKRATKSDEPPDSQPPQGLNLSAVAALAACIGMMLLAGHLQFAAYGLLTALILTLALLSTNLRSPVAWRGAAASAIAVLLGIGIASTQFVEVLAFSKESHRRNVPTAEGFAAYQAGALTGAEAAGILFPTLLGNPTQPWEEDAPISSYYPAFEHRGANFAESATGVGALAFIGLLFVPWRRLRAAHWGLVAAGAFALAMAFGTPVNQYLYFGVPGWSATGSPGRAGVLVVLVACVLAGVGFTRIEVERPGWKQVRLTMLVGGVLVALNLVAALSHAVSLESWMPGVSADAVRKIAFAGVSSAIPGIAVVLLACTFGLQAMARRIRGAQGIVLVAAALTPFFTLGMGFIRSGDSDLRVDLGAGAHERVAFLNGDWELLIAANAAMPPNTATIARIHDLAGYDSLMSRDSARILDEIAGGDASPAANGNIKFVKPGFDVAKLGEAGVTRIYSRTQLPGLQNDASRLGLFSAAIPSKGRAYTHAGPAEILEESCTGIHVKATGPGRLVVKDRAIGQWSATANGRPLDLKGETWLEVDLPEGESEVEFHVSPRQPLGTPIGLVLVGALAFAGRRAKQPQKHAPAT